MWSVAWSVHVCGPYVVGNVVGMWSVTWWSVTWSVCGRYVVGNVVGMWSVTWCVCGPERGRDVIGM